MFALDYWFGSGNEVCLIYRLFQVSETTYGGFIIARNAHRVCALACADGLRDSRLRKIQISPEIALSMDQFDSN